MYKNPDLITIDFSLPDYTGDILFQKIREVSNEVPVIVISGQEEISVAVKMLKLGVTDYLVKDDKHQRHSLELGIKAKETGKLKKEVETLREELGQKFSFEKSIKGQSPALNKIFGLMEKAIKTNINVSISGETGTGKEVVAKAIHYNSERKRKPFYSREHGGHPERTDRKRTVWA
jgi:DNA-binding NtrC family response regulator